MTTPAPSADLAAALAATRFGLGAMAGEIDRARPDPRAFLRAQIRPQGGDQPPEALASAQERLIDYLDDKRSDKADPQAFKVAQMARREAVLGEMMARATLAATTPAGFRERWTLFWSNHFTVSATKGIVAPIAGAFEREAIRPHVFGRFEDLLVASSAHPAMLLYLDQATSAGPSSVAGQRRKMGLNENLTREIMELHTLGVGSGYTQADVTEFARALTGWSITRPNDRLNDGQAGLFTYHPYLHEPGERKILGRTYGDAGQGQARAVLRDLAASPATARHVATKLARHFVADDPPGSLIARLQRAYQESDGRLDRVAEALIDAPEAWDPPARKFKTPYEFLVSSWRATGALPPQAGNLAGTLTMLGQKPFSPPSPKGWSEDAADWAAPDTLIKRIAWAEAFSKPIAGQADPSQTAEAALGARLTPAVASAVRRAESRPEALAILLMSPEFQRR